jgi:hypothetical protein
MMSRVAAALSRFFGAFVLAGLTPLAGQAAPAPRATLIAQHHLIVAAEPAAAEAGRAMLRDGGSAVDAAIAAQLVLTLVEPQSSGIGGGAYLIVSDGTALHAYDGRETAPASARPDMFLDAQGKARRHDDAVPGGLSVGVPGVVRMLAMAHTAHGKLPWAKLFEPAIRLAEQIRAASDEIERGQCLPRKLHGGGRLLDKRLSSIANEATGRRAESEILAHENDQSPRVSGFAAGPFAAADDWMTRQLGVDARARTCRTRSSTATTSGARALVTRSHSMRETSRSRAGPVSVPIQPKRSRARSPIADGSTFLEISARRSAVSGRWGSAAQSFSASSGFRS